MRSYFILLLIPFTAWTGQSVDPLSAMRRGDDALRRDDLAEAETRYLEAAPRTPDPGLISAKLGYVQQRMGRLDEAATSYRMSLQDAEGERRPLVQFNLGTCLLQAALTDESKPLDESIRLLRECLSNRDASVTLLDAARDNLETALLIAAQRKARTPKRGAGQNEEGADQKKDSRNPAGEPEDARDAGNQKSKPDKGAQDPGQTPRQTDQVRPGRGNLPPIADEEPAGRMSPEDAAEHLRRAIERIRQEQLSNERNLAPSPGKSYPDW